MQRGWLLLTIYLKKQRLAPAAFENPGLAPPQGTLAEPWLTLQESSPAGPGRGGGGGICCFLSWEEGGI